MLGFLRSRGVCAQAVVSSTAAEDLVAAFARHMLEQQGLASPTIERYTIAARQFLENRFGDGAVDMRCGRCQRHHRFHSRRNPLTCDRPA